MSSPRAGLSALEVLVALGILAVGLLGFFGLLVSSLQTQSTSHETELAVQAARAKLEEVRSLPLRSVIAVDGARTAFPVSGLVQPAGGLVELCRERNASGDLPSVVAELGQDLDLNGDGDKDDAPADDFLVVPVKVTVTW